MTTNQKLVGFIIGILFAILVFMLINVAFNTPSLPILVPDFSFGIYLETTML